MAGITIPIGHGAARGCDEIGFVYGEYATDYVMTRGCAGFDRAALHPGAERLVSFLLL